jgi:hypothetical protein
MFSYIVKLGRNLVDHYNIAIYSMSLIIALYIGSIILTRSRAIIWDHKYFKLPHELVFAVIGSMIMVVVPVTKMLGFNLLLAILPLYLIQGTAIMDFFWGVHFARSPILRFLVILVVILNYPILVLLMLVGLFDNWFNFRKIEIREENDENHFVE